jgi:hypothetical protein
MVLPPPARSNLSRTSVCQWPMLSQSYPLASFNLSHRSISTEGPNLMKIVSLCAEPYGPGP